jgi:hypothetical protein
VIEEIPRFNGAFGAGINVAEEPSLWRFCDTMSAPMRKPVRSIDEPEPKAPRADRPPTEGFVVIVDGHF